MENNKSKLTKLQITALHELAKSDLRNDFYWTGGTALAYFYLEHRSSYDIDLFSDRPIEYTKLKELINKISKTVNLKKIEEKKIFDRWEFIISNGQETRIDFVFYNHRKIKPRKKWQGIQVDSFDDLIANKTMALIDRNDPKDAFDIYYILKKYSLTDKKLLALVKKKFESEFTTSLFWSRCLLGAINFNNLKPFITGNSSTILKEITDYFEKKSADSIKNLL